MSARGWRTSGDSAARPLSREWAAPRQREQPRRGADGAAPGAPASRTPPRAHGQSVQRVCGRGCLRSVHRSVRQRRQTWRSGDAQRPRGAPHGSRGPARRVGKPQRAGSGFRADAGHERAPLRARQPRQSHARIPSPAKLPFLKINPKYTTRVSCTMSYAGPGPRSALLARRLTCTWDAASAGE